MGRSGYRLLALILILALFPVCSHAIIEEKSSIVGVFIDDSRKPAAGVTVRLLDSYFLNEVSRSVTDREGRFVIANVMPGLYLIALETASMQGLMKRIQVTSDSPTFVDIRPLLTEEELKNHNAWDKFKWTIRMSERNPLRDEEATLSSVEEPAPAGFLAALRDFQEQNNIEGQITYLNVGSGPSTSGVNNQLAQIAMQGELESSGSWSVNGNFREGPRSSYMAEGDFRYRLDDHQIAAAVSANDLLVARYPALVDRQRIVRFLQTPEVGGVREESSPWIASVDLHDQWRFWSNFEIGYGTRFDYYGYLQDSVGYSPRVRLSYHVEPGFIVHGAYYRNTSAPGNYFLQGDDVHPFIHDIAFVPYGSALRPETTTGFETGFDFALDDFRFSVVYHVDNVHDKIAAVDLSDSPVNQQLQSIRPFVIFNSRDISSRGMEISAAKSISRMSTALISYNMSQAVPVYIVEKRSFAQRQLYFMNGRTPEDFHDLRAGIQADIDETLTRVNASWKWSSGSPLVFGRKDDNVPLSALDVEVQQGLPVRVFDEAELKLLLAVKNLLDQNPDSSGNADFQRALMYGLPRTVAGGVLVQF